LIVMAGHEPLALIVAMTRHRVIGRKGAMPWHYPEDMKHFRRTTLGHAIIMGRATFDSIGKPLNKRRNIIVSRAPDLEVEGCEVASSVDAAIVLARQTDDEPFIVGGSQIYAAALPLVTRLFLTEIHQDHGGDVYFPDFDRTQWVEEERRKGEGLSFVTLARSDSILEQVGDDRIQV
jgi:dihydrofolate reductase